MIKGLMGNQGVIVEGGSTSLPYTSNNPGDTFSGVMRINSGEIQYYNMGSWINIPSSYATVKLDGSSEIALRWVKDKMATEASEKAARDYMEARAKIFPSLQKALEAIEAAEVNRDQDVKRAIENFHLLDKIAGEDQDNGPQSEGVSTSP
jgi:hypothetical protein